MGGSGFLSPDEVARLRQTYPQGTRIELVSSDDAYTTLRPGERGTVRHVDDVGTVFVDWDSGSRLGVVMGADVIKKAPGKVTDAVFKQILELRKTDGCPNMFDALAVQRMAYERGFYELVCFIEDDVKAYAAFILTGERA
jgi:hypothetical protein